MGSAPTAAGRAARVVIVGGGFGGLNAARALRRSAAAVVLLDRKNHHLFQPLLYQVATAALSPGNIATPLRKVFEKQRNCEVLLAEVESVDLEGRRVALRGGGAQAYDYLVIAAGARTAYFGHPDWARDAPGLKTIDDAITIRRRYLLAFERAEMEEDPAQRRRAMTFAIVGAGPTGVEMAGAMSELARETMRRSFRRLDTRDARVILIDGSDRVLQTFPEELSARAQRDLERLGVEVRLGEHVVDVDADGLTIRGAEGEERIEAGNIVWAAGVEGASLSRTLGAALDSGGRVKVGADLSIPGHPEAFVVGDLARVEDPETGRPVPGVAQGAIQMGRFVGRAIAREIAGARGARGAFRYHDKGEMATIGRARAVASIGRLRLAGLAAWVLWATVHVMYLIGFRSRLLTMLEWVWLYFFYDRGVRLITGRDARGGEGD